MKIIWTPKFQNSAKKLLKKNPELIELFKQRIKTLEISPFNPILKTHTLKGPLEGFYSCSINYFYRFVFEISTDTETNEEVIILINIGSHDEVY
ncbi:MAG: type II toxin-antitoxin system mRNA interferase toxin, RelE/StbE family [Ignavibacteriae bacterium]|nr:type II toxin-antitoxin system mRNA interferase toxin, RelE/StbE family [Ignavibacteriota bacterium]